MRLQINFSFNAVIKPEQDLEALPGLNGAHAHTGTQFLHLSTLI
jgi:hypothetical protein